MVEIVNSEETDTHFYDTLDIGRIDVFEKVYDMPKGYIVWNIGRMLFPHKNWLPIVKVLKDYSVDTLSMKALFVEDENLCKKLLDCSLGKKENKRLLKEYFLRKGV